MTLPLPAIFVTVVLAALIVRVGVEVERDVVPLRSTPQVLDTNGRHP